MVASTILTPSQAAAKNQKLPRGYQFVPTGFLSVCNGKRKRKPSERGEEFHSILERERPPPVTPSFSFVPYAVKQKKIPTQEELAEKEKQQKIALLKKRLELLKSRQAVLAAAQPSPSTATTLLVPERATPRTGKRVKKAVSKDLPAYAPSPSAAVTPRTDSKARRSGRVVKTPKFLVNNTPSPAPSTPAPKRQPSAPKNQPGSAIQQQLADLSASVANLSKQLAQKPAAERTPKIPKNLETVPLTNREKQMLKADIFKLPSNKLEPIIQMCSQNSGVEDKSEDSITIDIDKLDIPTLRDLQKYVKKCIGQINRKKGAAQKSPVTPAARKSMQSPLVEPSPLLSHASPSKPPPAVTPRVLPQRHLSESDSESDSSSGSSDSDSEIEEAKQVPLSTPQLPYSDTIPSLPAFDTAAWSNLGSDAGAPVGNHGDGLWSSFRTKEQEQRDLELERQQRETKLAAERAREVEELRKKAEEARSRQEAENLRLLREREQELGRNEQERENQREAARIARQTAQTVDLGQQSMMMDLMDSFG